MQCGSSQVAIGIDVLEPAAHDLGVQINPQEAVIRPKQEMPP